MVLSGSAWNLQTGALSERRDSELSEGLAEPVHGVRSRERRLLVRSPALWRGGMPRAQSGVIMRTHRVSQFRIKRRTWSESRCALSFSGRVLDPIERACEILFGVIMVLTFTGSISVAEGGATETRTVLAAAIGCNLAWGIVDAAMYLMANFAESRARPGDASSHPPQPRTRRGASAHPRRASAGRGVRAHAGRGRDHA